MKFSYIGFCILLAFFIMILSVKPSYAAKKFVPKKAASGYKGSGVSVPVVVRYRPDKLGILFSFSGFGGIDSVNYSFTYNTNGNPQGAGGTIRASNNPAVERELLFGTCSTSVCTYHSGLSNARLVFTANLTNGTIVTRSFRIKTYR